MEITNLFELKSYLKEQCDKHKSYYKCLETLNSYEIIGVETIQEYFDYLMPIQLMLEEQSVKYSNNNTLKFQKMIDDDKAKTIQVKMVKGK